MSQSSEKAVTTFAKWMSETLMLARVARNHEGDLPTLAIEAADQTRQLLAELAEVRGENLAAQAVIAPLTIDAALELLKTGDEPTPGKTRMHHTSEAIDQLTLWMSQTIAITLRATSPLDAPLDQLKREVKTIRSELILVHVGSGMGPLEVLVPATIRWAADQLLAYGREMNAAARAARRPTPHR